MTAAQQTDTGRTLEESTKLFPYQVETKRDDTGALVSQLFVHKPFQQEAKGKGKAGGYGPAKGYPGGGKGPPVAAGGKAKGAGKDSKPKLAKEFFAVWYSMEGNFKIDKSEAKPDVPRFTQDEQEAELEPADASLKIWNVALADTKLRLEMLFQRGTQVISVTRPDDKSGSTPQIARKTGNVFVTEVLEDAVLVKNSGLLAGDEVKYHLAGQTSAFGAEDADGQRFFVRPRSGTPSGAMELFDTAARAKAEKKLLSAPFLELAGVDGIQVVTVHCESHGFQDGELIALSGLLDKSKTERRPWNDLNAEFFVADCSSDGISFKLKTSDGKGYFDASACKSPAGSPFAFDGVNGKVVTLVGRKKVVAIDGKAGCHPEANHSCLPSRRVTSTCSV
eukprot:TRINITY_DN4464_c0_g1_i3.p1 TRINITY_DN4464_c0_g1~~TRINITY_DN4464_c0_g1_i3.p1  ORF type:complete len:392 (-),score=86.59 TRINITY_DN4464_c0_g1_i3:26-1201(-)